MLVSIFLNVSSCLTTRATAFLISGWGVAGAAASCDGISCPPFRTLESDAKGNS